MGHAVRSAKTVPATEKPALARPTRVRLDLQTWLVDSSRARTRVTVLDISKTGVRLQVPEPLLVGETVELELGRSGYAEVTICWSLGSEAGGTFVGME